MEFDIKTVCEETEAPIPKNYSASAMRQQDKNVLRIIGSNLKTARKLSNRTTKEVMRQIWGADSSSINLNRISEIENGLLSPSISVIAQLAQYYGCSIDYIFGLSDQQKPSIVAGNLCEMGRDIVESVEQTLIKIVDSMPRSDEQLLLESAKKVVHQFERQSLQINRVDFAKYEELLNAVARLRMCTLVADAAIQRNQKLAAATCDSMLGYDDEHRMLVDVKKTNIQNKKP